MGSSWMNIPGLVVQDLVKLLEPSAGFCWNRMEEFSGGLEGSLLRYDNLRVMSAGSCCLSGSPALSRRSSPR